MTTTNTKDRTQIYYDDEQAGARERAARRGVGAVVGSAGRRWARLGLMLALGATVAGCSDSPTAPERSALVTFAVGVEEFRVTLTDSDQIASARAAQAGGPANIPSGRIVAGTGVNVGWTWHLRDVSFAEATIELCDGLPSDVERAGVAFGGGRFCPWTARILSIHE